MPEKPTALSAFFVFFGLFVCFLTERMSDLPTDGLNLHAREAKGAVPLHTDNTFVRSIVPTPKSSCQRKADPHTHGAKGARVQTAKQNHSNLYSQEKYTISENHGHF